MSKLPQELSAGHTGLKAWQILLLAVLAQSLLLGFSYWVWSSPATMGWSKHGLMLAALTFSALGSLFIVVLLLKQQEKRFVDEDRVRQRLLDVINALPDPAAVRDRRGRYVLWNKAAEAYHGLAAKHAVGKTPHELFPPVVASKLLDLDKKAMNSDEVVIERVELPPLYGKTRRMVLLRCAPIHSVNNPEVVRGAVTLTHDVTQEESDAAHLKQSLAQLKLALDTSGFGAWIWDLENQVVIYSSQYERLMRYEGDQFRQDFDFAARVHPDDLKVLKAAAKRCIEHNQNMDITYRALCFDSQYRLFRACGEATVNESNRRCLAGLLCPVQAA